MKAPLLNQLGHPNLLASGLLLLGLVIAGCSPSSRKVVQEADRLMDLAFEQYTQGSFESASNSLLVYTAYLDSQEQRIASFRDRHAVDLTGKELDFTVSRDVPMMQLVPHSMLACMMVYAGNTNLALLQLSRAYQAHVESRTKAKASPVPRTNFVRFILDGREKIDEKAGAAWKAQFALNTNTVNAIADAWIRSDR